NIAGKAHAFMLSKTKVIDTPEEARGQHGMFKIAWCGSEDCARTLEVRGEADILGETETAEGCCPVCNTPTRVQALLARPY
ncbi:MAG: proline--tRNA ligase, partial [Halobacteriota archaeon]